MIIFDVSLFQIHLCIFISCPSTYLVLFVHFDGFRLSLRLGCASYPIAGEQFSTKLFALKLNLSEKILLNFMHCFRLNIFYFSSFRNTSVFLYVCAGMRGLFALDMIWRRRRLVGLTNILRSAFLPLYNLSLFSERNIYFAKVFNKSSLCT